MPRLTYVILPNAFKYKDHVTITSSTHFIPLTHRHRGAPTLLPLVQSPIQINAPLSNKHPYALKLAV